MTQRSRITQLLCLSVLLGFLSSAVFSAAEEANKAPRPSEPTAPQNSTLQSQEKAPGQPNSKDGEASAIASVAKLAVDMNNETVKRIEAFYANTVQIFAWHITVVATLVGLLGLVSVGVTAAAIAKSLTQKIVALALVA